MRGKGDDVSERERGPSQDVKGETREKCQRSGKNTLVNSAMEAILQIRYGESNNDEGHAGVMSQGRDINVAKQRRQALVWVGRQRSL